MDYTTPCLKLVPALIRRGKGKQWKIWVIKKTKKKPPPSHVTDCRAPVQLRAHLRLPQGGAAGALRRSRRRGRTHPPSLAATSPAPSPPLVAAATNGTVNPVRRLISRKSADQCCLLINSQATQYAGPGSGLSTNPECSGNFRGPFAVATVT